MGVKRSWDGNPLDPDIEMAENAPRNDASSAATISSIFTNFRSELDEHYDRRERIIKASRDITAFSKKIIFSLQRVRTLNTHIPKNIEKEISERFSQIWNLFTAVANELTSGLNAWRYRYQYSFGLQEYIEALSFQCYIEHGRLITQEEVVRSLPDGILVTNTDYLLGLFDFTGEIMKFAVTSMTAKTLPASQGDEKTDRSSDSQGADAPASATKTAGEVRATLGQGHDVVTDLRDLRAMFERLNVPRNQGISKDFQSKMDVMQASVEKVERAAYGLLVRGKERPTGWMPDMSATAPVETF